MQSDDVFCDMINSIQFLNMSKATVGDRSNVGHTDSGFNSGAEMNTDNIFFYEDCPSQLNCLNVKSETNEDEDDEDIRGSVLSSDACAHNEQTSPIYDSGSTSLSVEQPSQKEKEFTQIQVNVGIDEDLKMILEMDPSLMDVTLEKAVEASAHVVDCPKILGLPPKGWVCC